MKKLLFTICLLLLIPGTVSAQNLIPPAEKKCPEDQVYCRAINECISKQEVCLNIPIGTIKTISIGPNSNAFGVYLQQWYSFIIGSIGVIATVMMMWGGFKWLTSRGNSGAVTDAKNIIWSALTGVVLAFLSYSILYFINPATTRIGLPKITSYRTDVKVPNFSTLQGSGGDVSKNNPIPLGVETVPQCPSTNAEVVIDYSKVPAKNICTISSSHQATINKYSGGDKDKARILASIMAAESTCGANNKPSPAGACGIMQIMPDTARGLLEAMENSLAGSNNAQICEALRSDDELSIALATTYVNNAIEDGITSPADIFAGYNAGTATGAGNALGQSLDCRNPGVKAYQCCKNPGGLAETQNYVSKTMGQYNDLGQQQ